MERDSATRSRRWGVPTRDFVEDRSHDIERLLTFIRLSQPSAFIGLAIIVFGLAIAGSWGDTGLGRILPSLGLFLFGGVFAAIGGALLYFHAAPIVFDTRRGDFWKGRVAPYEMARQLPKDFAKLDRIHALQIVSEHCRSDNSSYYSHELNLVLEDGSRLNVVDHGNGGLLRADALALGEFLSKPVWDASVES